MNKDSSCLDKIFNRYLHREECHSVANAGAYTLLSFHLSHVIATYKKSVDP